MDTLQNRHDYVRANLATAMENLAQELTREAERLRANPKHVVNDLGVIQMRGQNIDLLCARLGVYREVLGL